MIDQKYWLEIGISPRSLKDVPSSWFREFKKRLKICCENDQQLLENFFDKKISVENNEELKVLFNSEQGIIFYGLVKYSIGKIDSIKDFLSKKRLYNDKDVVTQLINIFINNPELIIDHAYYDFFNKTRIMERWVSDKELNIEDFSIFENNYKLSSYTKKYRLGKNFLSRKFSLGNSSFFCFERAKRESVAMGFQEKKPLRKRGIYFIKITNNNIEIRTGDPRMPDFFNTIFKDLGYNIYLDREDIGNKTLPEIIASIIEFDKEDPKITSIEFSGMEKGVNCKINLDENHPNHRLRESLKIFESNGLIDLSNLNKLKSFVIEFGGVSQKIIIDRSDPESIIFNLTSKGMNDKRYNQIVKILKTEFGIALRIPYQKEGAVLDSIDIFANMINKLPSNLTKRERELYSQIAVKKLLQTKKSSRCICLDKSHVFNGEFISCPECGSDMKILEPREHIALDEDKFLDFLVARLNKIFGEKTAEIRVFDIGKSDKPFVYFKVDQLECYLYLQTSKRLGKMIEKNSNSMIPMIEIICDKKNIRLNLGDYERDFYAYNLIFDNDEEIKGYMTSQIFNHFTSMLNEKSDYSYKELRTIIEESKNITGDDFEDLCYPLLKRCLYGLYKWGKETKGKPVPDGLYGIKRNRSSGFSLIYDCKFSKDEYNLDRAEKLKAKDYIKRTNQSPEVKKFSAGLNAYMIVSNNANMTQFDNLVKIIEGYQSWTGKMIFIGAVELLYLFEKFKEAEHNGSIKRNFGLAFSDYIIRNNERKIIIDQNLIDIILDNSLKLSEEIKDIEVLNHLKTDIEY